MPRSNPEGRRTGSRKIRQGSFIAPPGLDPRPSFFASPLPREANACQLPSSGPDQGRGLSGCPTAQPLNQPSRRTLFLRALGHASRSEVIMYKNTAADRKELYEE